MMAALLFVGAVSAHAALDPTPTAAGRIVVVLVPYMTWDDVAAGRVPAMREAAEAGLVSNMNVRSGTVGAGAGSVTQGALMLSAGSSAVADDSAMTAYDASETVDALPARAVYAVLTGRSAGDASIVYLGAARQAAANAETTSGSRIGALGDAVRAAGLRTAAVGNADLGIDVAPEDRSRPAGVASADASGVVELGTVSPELLRPDSSAPFGVRADEQRIEEAFRTAVDQGARFLVIDPGEMERAAAFASFATSAAAEVARIQALSVSDRVVRTISMSLTSDDLLVVLAPVPDQSDGPMAFAPLIMRGGGLGVGLARTPSTQRDGMCTIRDVSATLVRAAGAGILPEMAGSPILGSGPSPLSARLDALRRLNGMAVAVEAVRLPATNTFITVTIVVLLGSTLLLSSRARSMGSGARRAARFALVMIQCVLLAGLLQFAVARWPASGTAVVGALLGVAVLLLVLVMAVGRGRPVGVPMIAVTSLTVVSLLVDQWLGAPLSIDGVFGYSVLFGARYYGIGNEMAGLLFGSTAVAFALAMDVWPSAPWVPAARRWGWPIAGAVVVMTSALPTMGANLGTAAWMTVGFLVGWLMLNGRRVWTWRTVVVAVVLVGVLAAGFTAFDVLRGTDAETHVGRVVSGGQASAPARLWSIVMRKAETNMRVLGRTNWTWLLAAVLLLLGSMRWRPSGGFAALLDSFPAYSAALAAGLFAGVMGFLTEDSGIIVPAFIMLPLGLSALYLMLARVDGDGGGPW
jgi:hypothetical protein